MKVATKVDQKTFQQAFWSRLAVIAAWQTSIGEAASSVPANIFFWRLGTSRRFMRAWRNLRTEYMWPRAAFWLFEKVWHEFQTNGLFFWTSRRGALGRSRGGAADLVPIEIERKASAESFLTKDKYLDDFPATVRTKSDYIQLLKGHMVQPKAPSEKTKAAFERQIGEAEALQDDALEKMTVHRDCLPNLADQMSCDQIMLSVVSERARCQLLLEESRLGLLVGSEKSKRGNRRLQQRRGQSFRKNWRAWQHNLHSPRVVTVGDGRFSILTWAKRDGFWAAIDRFWGERIKHLQIDLHGFSDAVLAVLDAPTSIHRDRLPWFIAGAFNHIPGRLKALVETIEVLSALSAILDYFRLPAIAVQQTFTFSCLQLVLRSLVATLPLFFSALRNVLMFC